MSTEQAHGFFREVYSDKTIQGQMHHALVMASPEVVVQIARSRGYEVSADDIVSAMGGEGGASHEAGNRHDKIVEHVMARDFWVELRKSPVWKRIEAELGAFDPFREAPPFRMTIPGPSWVQVMGGGRDPGPDTKTRPSAVELYDSIR